MKRVTKAEYEAAKKAGKPVKRTKHGFWLKGMR